MVQGSPTPPTPTPSPTPTPTPTPTPIPGPQGTVPIPNPNGSTSQETANWFLEHFPPWFPDWLAQLLLAIVALVITWYISRLVAQLLGRRVARRFQRPSVSRTILRLIRLAIIGIGVVFVVAGIYEFELSNIVLSVTVFSAVTGVVLAPIVGSIVSGLFVLADQPYEVGDMIELADTGQRGFVEDITIRYTKLFTLDNTFLVLPNGLMRERDVINYSAEDPRTRLSLDIVVTYEGDLDEARKLIEDAARQVDNVVGGGPSIRIGSARYPAAPTCYINSYADHGVQLTLRYWVRKPYKLLTMRSRVQEKVWEYLEDANVEFAYPHSHVVFDETSGQLDLSMQDGREEDERDRSRRSS